MKTLIKILCLTLILFSCGNDKKIKIELSNKELSVINNGIINGAIKVEPHLARFQVHPNYWSSLDMSTKEGFSSLVAKYIASSRGTDLVWCDIYDMKTGQKIAKYSKSWGFEIY